MTSVERLHPSQVSAADRAAWRRLLARSPEWDTPFLRPGFADIVGAVRPDAVVMIYRQGAAVVGVLPCHLRPGRFARPLAAPFSDRHALIADPEAGLDLRTALSLAGVSAYRFTQLTAPFEAGLNDRKRPDQTAIADLSQGASAFLEEQNQAHKRFFKNLRRLARKAESEVGPTTFTFDDRDPAAFETLMTWKRERFRESGLTDVLEPAWARAMMSALFNNHDGEVRGVLSTLRFGGRLAAAEFNLVGGGVCQGWIVGYEPAFAAYSPGQQCVAKLLEACDANGVKRYELGPGGSDYKKYFANHFETLWEGLAVSPSTLGRLHAFSSTGLRLIEDRAAPRLAHAAGRARRRLDQIAALEINALGRARSMFDAVTSLRRRAS